MCLRIANHAIDFLFRELRRAGDLDRLLFPCVFVASRYRQNAIGVDVECHLNLRRSPRSRSNALEFEMTESPIVPGQLALTLQYVYINSGLVIFCSGKDFAAPYGDGGISLD